VGDKNPSNGIVLGLAGVELDSDDLYSRHPAVSKSSSMKEVCRCWGNSSGLLSDGSDNDLLCKPDV